MGEIDSTLQIPRNWSEGSAFGAFVLEGHLGKGGFGTVYLARHPVHGKVALKILAGASESAAEKRFLREAGLELHHPSIPRVYEHGVLQEVPYMAQELIVGEGLLALVASGQVAEERAAAIVRQLALALAHAHEKGVIHRDLKPENIIIRPDGAPVILDFGIARVMNLDTLTAAGTFLGSPRYMSPEQVLGDPVGPPADLYSLGVILYQLVAGQLPIDAADLTSLLFGVVHRSPVPASVRRPGLSRALDRIIARLLEKRPEARFSSAQELVAALDATSYATDTDRRPPGSAGAVVVGRAAEIGMLLAASEAATSGGGRVAVVRGETGIGKSRLLDEVAALLRRRGVVPGLGRAIAVGSVPYQPLLGALAQILDRRGISAPAELDAYLGRDTTLAAVAPILKALLQTDAPLPTFAPEQIWEALRRIVTSLAEASPLLIALDDMHHADAATVSALGLLARGLRGGALILVAYRSDELAEDHPLQRLLTQLGDAAVTLTLARLGEADVRRLAALHAGAETVAPELVSLVMRESEGNPLYAVEVLSHLDAEGALSWQRSEVGLVQDAAPAAPRRIAELLERRLATLEAGQRDLLEIAAVEGVEFTSDVLVAASGEGRISVLKRLRAIESRHGLVRAQERSYRFDHARIRDVLYGALPAELRREYHRLIGEHLEGHASGDDAVAAGVAHHLEQAGLGSRAAPFALRAARRARAVYATELALRSYDAYLRLSPSLGPDAVRARCEKASILEVLGRNGDALAEQRSALDVARRLGDREGQVLAMAGRGRALERLGRLDEAGDSFGEAAEAARAAALPALEASALSGLATIEMKLGRRARALELGRRSLELCRSSGDRGTTAWSLARVGTLLHRLESGEEGIAHLEESLALFRELGDASGEASAHVNLANALVDVAARERAYRTAAEEFRRIGHRVGEAMSLMNLALLRPPAEKAETLETAIQRFREIQDRGGEALAVANLADTLFKLGEHARAADTAATARLLAEQIGDRRLHAWSTLHLGQATTALGKLDEGLAFLAASREEFGAIEDAGGGATAAIWIARNHLARGDEAAAEAALAAAEALHGDDSDVVRWIAETRALPRLPVAGGPPPGAETHPITRGSGPSPR